MEKKLTDADRQLIAEEVMGWRRVTRRQILQEQNIDEEEVYGFTSQEGWLDKFVYLEDEEDIIGIAEDEWLNPPNWEEFGKMLHRMYRMSFTVTTTSSSKDVKLKVWTRSPKLVIASSLNYESVLDAMVDASLQIAQLFKESRDEWWLHHYPE